MEINDFEQDQIEESDYIWLFEMGVHVSALALAVVFVKVIL